MKNRLADSGRRILSLIVAFTVMLSGMPVTAMAEGEICNHIHGEDCSYVEGADCNFVHEHDGDCGYDEATGSPCAFVHNHDEDCGYVEAVDCDHEHDADCGGDTLDGDMPLDEPETDDDIESATPGNTNPTTANIPLGYSVVGFAELADEVKNQSVPFGTALEALSLPVSLDATISDGEDETDTTIESVTWLSEPEYAAVTIGALEIIPAGIYVFTPELPEGYTLAEGVALPVITVELQPMGIMAAAGSATVNNYSDLQTATQSSGDAGDIITLGADITDGAAQLTIGRTLTLDLNGHNLTITVSNDTGIKIAAGVTLTIKDSNPGTNKLSVKNTLASEISGKGAGINVTDGKLLIESGTIEATGGRCGAGIGGGHQGAGGTITISGGTVRATGGSNSGGTGGGAGIGGGSAGAGGTVTISGGTINATGGMCGAGIGGGRDRAGGTVTISGGTVSATGGVYQGAGIGGGELGAGGTVTISGGTVSATGGGYAAGIGGGSLGSNTGSLKITGGSVKITAGAGAAANLIASPTNGSSPVYLATLTVGNPVVGDGVAIDVCNIDNNGYAYGIYDVKTIDGGKAYFYLPAVTGTLVKLTIGGDIYSGRVSPDTVGGASGMLALTNRLDVSSDSVVISSVGEYEITGATTTNTITVNSGITANITLKDVNIQLSANDACAFDMTGATVYLTLSGTNTLKSGENTAGLQVPANARLTVTAESTGSLTATGGQYGAGVGGGKGGDGGTVTISGGSLSATGGGFGAGIGGGMDAAGGTLTISGGTVTAQGKNNAAGIGGGQSGTGGTIIISGGMVNATSDNIGTGIGGNADTVTINGGTISAQGGSLGGSGIVGTVTINGGIINAKGGLGGAGGFGISSGTLKITGGSLKDSSMSSQPTNGSSPVYLTTLQVGSTPVTGKAVTDGSIAPIGYTYGLDGVKTDEAGKVYFYLPVVTDIQVRLTVDGVVYSGKVSTTADNAASATLKLPNDNYDVSVGNVVISTNGAYTITGTTTTNVIKVNSGVTAEITLNNVTVNVGGNLDAYAFDMSGATVDLTLRGTNTLNSGNVSLHVPVGAKLTVTGENNSSLTALSEYYGAGIGGGYGETCGEIIINSGVITAQGSSGYGYGAGIGGGGYQGAGGTVTIRGGTVTATGSGGGAGIGGCDQGAGGTVTITGGTVKATGGRDAAGIGGGSNGGAGGEVTITGGTVTATGGSGGGGAGIGGGRGGAGGTVIIINGSVTATGGSGGGGAGIGGGNEAAGGEVTITGGTVIAKGGSNSGIGAAGIGGGSGSAGGKITISGGMVTAQGGSGSAGIGAGARKGAIIDISGGTVNATGGTDGAGIGSGYNGGDSTITISGGSVTAQGGLYSAGIGGGCDNTTGIIINISGGTVKATGGSGPGGAGIGAGYRGSSVDIAPGGAGCTITISGNADVTAKGGAGGAGIGTGNNGRNSSVDGAGKITIEGGTVSATGTGGGAGIGGGAKYSGGEVTINGGTVTAQGSGNASGIGGGDHGRGGTITVNGGIVNATGGQYATGIGGGYGANGYTDYNGNGGVVTIGGGTVTATGGDYGAGIGGGFSGYEYLDPNLAGSLKITGGSVKITSSANAAAQQSPRPTNGASYVYLATLTVGSPAVGNGHAISDYKVNGSAYAYGLTDVQTVDGGKVYFYLPEAADYDMNLDANGNTYGYFPISVNTGNTGVATLAIRKDVAGAITAEQSGTLTYTGLQQAAAFTVVIDGTTLTAGTDYTLSNHQQTNAGTYTATITGRGGYNGQTTANFTVAKATLTPSINFTGATGKTYDGTTAVGATPPTISLTGAKNGEQPSATATFAFNDANVGVNKSVNATNITLSGSWGDNYALSTTTLTAVSSVNITAKPVTINGVTATNRDYDGTTAVALTGGALQGIESGDTGNVGFTPGSGTADSKDVGTGKTVTTNITLTGTAAGNYTLTQPNDVTVDITAKAITINGVTAINRVYNGTTTVALTGGALQGVESGDTGIGFTPGSGTIAEANAGTGKAVSTNIALTGNALGNYTLTQPNDVTVDITAKAITINGVTATDRAYDGTTSVALTGGVLQGVESGDTGVGFTHGSGTIASANVGTGKAVTTNITLTGDTNGNYALTQPTTVTVNIAAKPVTITPDAGQSKAYGEADQTFTFVNPGLGGANGLYGTDGLTGALSRVAGENVGTYDITSGNLSAGGNYALTLDTTPVTFAITPAVPITDHTVTRPVQNGAVRTIVIPLAELDPDPGSGKSLGTVSNYALSGYSVGAISTNAVIDATNLTITSKNNNEGFTGTENITAEVTTQNFGICSVTVTLTAVDKQPVTITGISVAGKTYNGLPVTPSGTVTVTKTADGLTVGDYATPLAYTYTSTDGGGYGGTTPPSGAGAYKLVVSTAASDPNYVGGSADINFTISKANQTALSITGLAGSYSYDASAITLGTSGGTTAGTVTYISSNTGVATVSGNTVSIVGVGTFTITATMAGNANYNDVSVTSGTITINKASQAALSITGLSGTHTYGDSAIALGTAGGTTAGMVTYTSNNTSVATVSGNTVSIVGAGSFTITATMEGNANYNNVSATSGTITVNKANQVALSITGLAGSYTYGDSAIILGTTGGTTAGTVTYMSNNTSVTTVSGNTITLVGAGSFTITATMAGTANYNSVSATSGVVTVNPAVITSAAITVTAPVRGETPSTTATGTGGFSVGAVSWNGSPTFFASSTQYTATVILTANNNCSFTGGLATATINGNAATVTNSGNTAILTYQFAATQVATVPDAPQNFTATAGNGQATLSWRTPANNGGSAITHYEVSSDDGANWITASSGTGHTFTGLTNGTQYKFKVRAVNAQGGGATTSATATPIAPPSGNSGGSRGGSGGSGDGSGTATTTTPAPTETWLEQNSAGTLANGTNSSNEDNVRTKSDGAYGVRAAAWAKLAGMRFEHDTMDGNAVQVRLYINSPETMIKDTMVSAYVKGAEVDYAKNTFEKYFDNKVWTIHFDQQGTWGQPVNIAARVDLTGIDTKNLYFYTYDKKANIYRRIEKPAYWIDKNGYLHFTTEYAGDIIISDGPLEKKS